MASKKEFDIAVIGAGPGGYVAAIKATQYGKKVALIEKGHLGGTCLNVGCIPTKTLLANSSVLKKIKEASLFGIDVENISISYDKMKERKDQVVSGIRSSLEGLIKSNQIEIIYGQAEFTSPKELKVKGEKTELIKADKIIIATGSEVLDIKAFPCDHKQIMNSSSILDITTLPKSLAVVGGGYIGCEFASLFAELGVKVTILEALPSIIQAQGPSLSSFLSKSFEKQGIEIKTEVFVEKIDKDPSGVKVHLKGGETVDAEMALISVGRRLNTDGLNLNKAGLSTTDRGAIEVNDQMETSVKGIYAIGDVTGIAMLAHVASHQGVIAANNACMHTSHIHYEAIPAVIFTSPEIAMVGLDKQAAEEKGYQVSVGKFPLMALGKSQASMETDGFVEIVADKETGQILGAQMIGHEASIMISEMTVAVANELTLECITETIHAHPTLSEAWLEAAHIAEGNPIHFPPKR